jgi:hypothetical protein
MRSAEVSVASLDAFASEAIAASPVRALRAGFSLWVVDAFFVRAADEAVGDDHRLGGVLFEEGENLLANGGVGTDVGILGEPTFKRVRLAALVTHDGNNDLGGEIGGGGGWPGRSRLNLLTAGTERA